LFGKFPFLKKLFADGGYQEKKFRDGQKKALPSVETEILKRSLTTQGFEVLARPWVVERTFAWLGRCRRLPKDWECLNRNALAFLYLASIRMMLRKSCN
jgi:transposase